MSDSWQDLDESHRRNSDDDLEEEEYRDTGAEFVKGECLALVMKKYPLTVGNTGLREMEAFGLVDIGALGSWSVSSHKAGSGIKELREDSPLTFWQSDGVQPHNLDIHFSKRVTVSRVSIFTDFALDESYTPSKIVVLAGHGFHDLLEVITLDLSQPSGWTHVEFDQIEGLETGLKTFLIRLLIVANHQHGKDTHLRAVKIYSPSTVYSMDTTVLGPFTSRKLASEATIR